MALTITLSTSYSKSYTSENVLLPSWRYNKKNTKGYLEYKYRPLFNLLKDNGLLYNMTSKELNFSFKHPVLMIPLVSYDGSMNLIINDGQNIPRLINSRFTVREHDLYERVDRVGENDSNIYKESDFKLLTSLLKLYDRIPKITFGGEDTSGNLKVGDYVFYFVYCDDDENETDIVAESGKVTVFKGQSGNPFNVEGGFRDENSYKSINFKINNIDKAFPYLKVYYIRSSADLDENVTKNAFRIYKKYRCANGVCFLNINGLEPQEEIPVSIINTLYANISTSKSAEIIQNRLFLGNNELLTPDYKELTDLSLRICPTYQKTSRDKLIGDLEMLDYKDNSVVLNYGEYYNTNNIYNYTGYAPNEIYRIGIVYILKDNSLSPVFDIRGKNGIPKYNTSSTSITGYDPAIESVWDSATKKRLYLNNIDENTSEFIGRTDNENAKGVIRIEDNDDLSIYSLKFYVPAKVKEELKKYIKGYFFVRLKRMPLCLGQALTLPIEINSHLPLIPYYTKVASSGKADLIGLVEGFMDAERTITHEYNDRLLYSDITSNTHLAALIFPDYELNQPYYNSILTGGNFYVEEAYYNNSDSNSSLNKDRKNERHYYMTLSGNNTHTTYSKAKLIQVPDNMKLTGIDEYKFAARAGEAEEGFRYAKVYAYPPYEIAYKVKKRSWLTNIGLGTALAAVTGGMVSPVVGTILATAIDSGKLTPYNKYGDVDVNISESTNSINYVRGSFGPYVGMTNEASSINFGKIVNVYIPGYSPSKIGKYFSMRYDDTSEYSAISQRVVLTDSNIFNEDVYRGDSYVCNFTHRLNRNFNDPTVPLNDTIIDKDTWKNAFDVKDGVVDKTKFDDINLSDLNAVKMGSWITFKVRSSNNLSLRSADSSNVAENILTGHPRVFYPLYPMLEDGTFKVPESNVRNKAYSTSLGSKVYFGLPDAPYFKNVFLTRIYYSDIYITDAFTNGYRRILSTNFRDYDIKYGGIVKLISYGRDLICVFEHGIGKLSINQSTPISQNSDEPVFINSHNVLPESMSMISDTIGSQWADSVIKTEACIYGVDTHAKKIWRIDAKGLSVLSDLKIQQFLNNNITLSEHETETVIGVRNVKTHYNKNKGDVIFTYYDDLKVNNEEVWSITWNEFLLVWVTFNSWIPSFSTNIYNTFYSFNRDYSKYRSLQSMCTDGSPDVQTLTISMKNKLSNADSVEPIKGHTTEVSYEIVKDLYGFKDKFTIDENGTLTFAGKDEIAKGKNKNAAIDIASEYGLPFAIVNIKVEIKYNDSSLTLLEALDNTKYIGAKSYIQPIVYDLGLNIDEDSTNEKLLNYSNWFWVHGKTGLFDKKGTILPTMWYNRLHPFEFEFVVNDRVDRHKIFDSLEIISNNAEPESFHYEIVGDCFDFAKDKLNMYVRQEATKHSYLLSGTDITYNPDYANIKCAWNECSTLLPLYYFRLDKLNYVEDIYHLKDGSPTSQFDRMAGGEILKDSRSSDYYIWNHVKASDIRETGRIQGNMHYKEDKWYVLINPLNILEYNEPYWEDKPPIEYANYPIPEDVLKTGELTLPNWPSIIWPQLDVYSSETKIKDKWVKIRIRYSGKKLAIIHSVQTLYSISMS